MSECSQHPCAPHGFNRNASHSEDRYVCDCEYWHPDRTCQGEKLKSQADALAEALSAVMAYRRGDGEYNPQGLQGGELENFRHDMWHVVEDKIGAAMNNYRNDSCHRNSEEEL